MQFQKTAANLRELERYIPAKNAGLHFAASFRFAFQNRLCQRLRDEFFDGAFHWACAKRGAETLFHHQRIDGLIECEPEALSGQAFVQSGDELPGNRTNVLGVSGLKTTVREMRLSSSGRK